MKLSADSVPNGPTLVSQPRSPTTRRAVGDGVRGCCYGTDKKHPDVDHQRQLHLHHDNIVVKSADFVRQIEDI